MHPGSPDYFFSTADTVPDGIMALPPVFDYNTITLPTQQDTLSSQGKGKKKKKKSESQKSITKNKESLLLRKSKPGTDSKPSQPYSPGSFTLRDIVQGKRNEDTLRITQEPQYSHTMGDNLIPVKNSLPQPVQGVPDWLFFILLLLLILFAWLKVAYNKVLRRILEAFFSNTVTNQVIRDENTLIQKASVSMTIIFNIVFALLLYQSSLIYEWEMDYAGTGLIRFLLFALLISFAYTFKFLILKTTGLFFKIDRPMTAYIFNIFLINNIIGIVLLPLLIGVFYLPNAAAEILLIISLAVIALAYLYRLLRGVSISLSFTNFSKIYLFVYLCTLEIVPLLMLVKLFFSYVNTGKGFVAML